MAQFEQLGQVAARSAARVRWQLRDVPSPATESGQPPDAGTGPGAAGRCHALPLTVPRRRVRVDQKQSPYQWTAPGAVTVARTDAAVACNGRAIPGCSVTWWASASRAGRAAVTP